jgi:hypothetical protein
MRGRIPLAMASVGLASFLFLIIPLSARAAEEVIYKKVSASNALKTAAKNLAKSKSYRSKMNLEGGFSEREDHELTDKAVKESFEGDMFATPQGNLMHVPKETGMEAYRYPKKGTAFVQGAWRSITSDAKSRKMERLFTFPDLVLSRAIASGNAKWIKPPEEAKNVSDAKEKKKEAKEGEGEEQKGEGVDTSNNSLAPDVFLAAADDDDDGDKEPEDKPAEKKATKKETGKKETEKKPTAKADSTKDPKTKTVAKKAPADKPAEEEQQPRWVRVEASPKEALEHFTDIQNSGCLGAG